MSDVQESHHEQFKQIEAAENESDDEVVSDQLKVVSAHLKGIFEMLAQIAYQLEKLNANLKANDSE